jgi:hypothetical protein
LCYLAPDQVQDSFAFDLMEDAPDDPITTSFADYILKTYVTDGAIFPPDTWADVAKSRTTNDCESFHAHFAEQFSRSHPNVYEFADKLKDYQVVVYTKHNAINENVQKEQRKYVRQKLASMKTRKALPEANGG